MTGAKIKQQRDMRRDQATARAVRFTIRDIGIETVGDFKYLRRITSDDDDNLAAVRENLKKVRKSGQEYHVH
jgi:hypothetical protein